MRYHWISQHQQDYPVTLMCEVLEVSSSGFYDSLRREPSPQAQRQERIQRDVQAVYDESDGIYGSWKIAQVMAQCDQLESACRGTVLKAMRQLGLQSRVCKPFKPMTTQCDPSKRPALNLLDQDFQADEPNRKWVTDITYLPTSQGWVYLAVVMDLFSRKVVGWSMGNSLATGLVSEALRRAVEARRPERGRLLHHSDRGCQYTSNRYQQILSTLGITCSMSRVGCCYDNAVMERFFWSLKQEWTNHDAYADLDEAKQSVFKYIEMFYNSKRIHQALGYVSPEQYEAEHAPVKKVA